MIFEPLAKLYDELLTRGDVPRPGFTFERIGGEIVLSKSGQVVDRTIFLRQDGKALVRRKMDVPASCGRTSGVEANILWDKTAYTLGVTAKLDAKKKPILDNVKNKVPTEGPRTSKEHARFIERHDELFRHIQDDGTIAIAKFLAQWTPSDFLSVFPIEFLDENLVFRLEGDVGEDGAPRFIHERPAVASILEKVGKTLDTERVCAITGELGACVSNHPAIKGVKGAQSSGAYLSSFNFDSSKSFGLEGAENAPVSTAVASKAAAALNLLLERDSGRKVLFGDTTVVFWLQGGANAAQDEVDIENAFLLGVGAAPSDQATEAQVASLFEAVRHGKIDPDTYRGLRFCMLGLAPSDARLRVRFYHEVAPFNLLSWIASHQAAVALDGQHKTPRPWTLLASIARKDATGKALVDKLSPHLERDLQKAIIEGAPYPQGMLAAVIERIRAEKGDEKITPTRIALIKAILSRMPQQKDIPMGLDPKLDDVGYHLGRLFSLIEGTQRNARPDIRATIRDRYMSSASTTPASIFPELLRAAQPNMTKMRRLNKAGLAAWFDREIAEICGQIDGTFPRTLTLPEQGRFFAGYYQQAHARRTTETTPAQEQDQ